MRYVVIPETVEITLPASEGGTRPYSFTDLNNQHVWNHEIWRDGSKDNAEMVHVLYEKLKDAEPGDIVELTDREYEAYAPIATLRGEKIRSDISMQLHQLMKPVLLAPTKKPTSKQRAASEDDSGNGAKKAGRFSKKTERQNEEATT